MPFDTPIYIRSLITPRNGQKVQTRRVWSIDLAMVWLPFLTATNVTGQTHLPADALGAPLRLGYNADGSVKFSKAGRPVFKVAKDIADTVRLVRDNFVANLQDYASQVMTDMPDQFQHHLDTATKAGEPIKVKDNRSLDKAVVQIQAQAIREAGKKEKVEKIPVPA